MTHILKFYIVQKPSGICIFNQTFEELPGKCDPYVISGFLFAISNLSIEIAKQDIEFLQLNSLRFFYLIRAKYIMIMVSSKDSKQSKIYQLLEQIQVEFEKRYLKVLEAEFSGDITGFKSFAHEIELILETETKYIQYIDKRNEQLSDLFQSRPPDWLILKNSLEKTARSFGTWIVKEINPLNKKLKTSESESEKKGSWI
jgi:hypothetical protein